MTLESGSRLDVYQILRPLGSGGMGMVWLATETRLGRSVAIKVLPPALTREETRVMRFEQEARAASTLNHPNVCTVYALGETAEGIRYIAMEYVEGATLRDQLATRRFTILSAVDIGIQVAAALTAAHAAGIVHRDIKPENVMIRPDGLAKVLDFGIAKLAPVGESFAETTRMGFRTDAGTAIGTVAYMSPEQARGEAVDPRTDIWSLGVVLYEMIAGRSPFAAASTTEVLAAILDRDPAPLARFEPGTPVELQRIITKTLRKDRGQRYQTVRDLLTDLETLRDELQAQRRSESSPPMSEPPTRVSASASVGPSWLRHRRWIGISGLAVAALLGTWWVWTHTRPPVQPAHAPPSGAGRVLTRLTFDTGLQTDATFSPDGRFVAYASDKSGNFDIWVQPVSGGNAVQITRSPAQDIQPDWSPDGSTLVFRSEREGGGLFVVPALGGPERRLTTFGTHPHWLSNSSEILFMSSMVSPDEAGFGGSSLKVYITSIVADRPTEILSDFVKRGTWYWVGAHPDGRISLFGSSDHDRPPKFVTVSRDGTRAMVSDDAPELPAVLRASNGGIRRFHWNPSGTALYVEAVVDGIQNLWKVNVDRDTLKWQSAERLTTSSSNHAKSVLSADGTRLAFTSLAGSSRLWAFPLDSRGDRIREAAAPITEDGADVEDSDVSADGRKIAFVLVRQGRPDSELWTSEIETGTRELIRSNAGGPRWSPDGTELAYYLENRLVVRDSRGKERTIALIRGDFPPPLTTGWTPDARGIVASWTGRPATAFALTLWAASADGAERPTKMLLEDNRFNLWQGQLSPNGRWISFVAESLEEPDHVRAFIVPAAGAPRAQWLPIAGDHESPDKPRWSHDGRTLYFLSKRPASFLNLWAVHFDPEAGRTIGQPFVLTRFDSQSRMISPNMDKTEMGIGAGRALLNLRTVTGSVWMLDHVDR